MASPTNRLSQIIMQNTSARIFARSAIALTLTSVVTLGATGLSPISNIAQSPLELTPTVPPNVMVLVDQSGSMDFEVMTADTLSAGLFIGPDPDGSQFGSMDPALQITQRTGCELVAAAFGGYAYGVGSSLNQYQDASNNHCYVADSQAWRFRCSSFNSLYYDPTITYEPWEGFNDNNSEFTDVTPTAAPLNPYLSSSPTVDLTSPDLASTGLDAFRYYTCSRGSDGVFVQDSETVINATSPDLQNFANWFSYHRSRHLRAKAILGKFIFEENDTRIGLVGFNSIITPSMSLPVAEMNASAEQGSAKRILLDRLYSTSPNQLQLSNEESPLHKRYLETARYLKCQNSDFFTGSVECPAESAPAGTCQPNHILIASDGYSDRFPFSFFSGEGDQGVGDEDSDPTNEFSGGAFANPVSTFSSFLRTMSDVVILFYKEDLQPSIPDDLEPTSTDIHRYPSTPALEPDDILHQHIKTHVLTYGVPFKDSDQSLLAFPPDPTSAFAWRDPNDTDLGMLQDLVHAAYSGRGEYIRVTDPVANQQMLSPIIAQGVGMTTPVAINTQNATGDIILYRALYDSSSNSGDLVAQVMNADGTLNEENGEPVFIWSAARQLDVLVGNQGLSHETNRTVFTYSPTSNDGINFLYDDLDPGQKLKLDFPVPLNANPLPAGNARLEYLRGVTTNEGTSFIDGEFRIRPDTENFFGVDQAGNTITHKAKLGTIANAAPVFVGQPQAIGRFGGAWPSAPGETYLDFQTEQANRDGSVVAAANDGMVHVFNADNGSERFAYVPNLLFDELSTLTLPEYKHQYYVDSTPSVNDAYINVGGGIGWRTIVVGGLGAGGRGYYALDITDPGPASNPADQVLWEFAPEDDPDANSDGSVSDLGLSFGEPLIAMSNEPIALGSNTRKWVAVFGNGYNSTSANGNAVIYLLFIDQGVDGEWSNTDLVKIDTGVGGVSTPNGISTIRAIDTDGNGTIDRLYAGDLLGNLHVIDISSEDSDDWALASSRFILFEAVSPGTSTPQPITTRPIVTNNTNGPGVIVIFATGSYFTRNDAINTDIQSLYGVVDETAYALPPDSRIGTTVGVNSLTDRELTNRLFEDSAAGISLEIRTISENPEISNSMGWVINFDAERRAGTGTGIEFPGEKAIRGLQIRNNVLFVSTVIPQALSCDPAPGGFTFGLDPQTGRAGSEVVFDINADSVFDDQDKVSVFNESGIVAGIKNDNIISDTFILGDKITIIDIEGNDQQFSIPPTNSELEGRQAWREVILQ